MCTISKMSRLFCTIALLFFVSKPAFSAPFCPDIIKGLAPCLSYLQGQEASPQCCAGVKGLGGIAKTKQDRVSICECVKKTISKFTYDPKLIPVLPQKCGVDLALPPVDRSYNCSMVSAY